MRLPIASFLCLGALLLAGCAGYHLGPANDLLAGDKTIEVFPLNNQTLQPRLGDAITQALREHLQTDGTYHLVSHKGSDLVLTGEISRYYRQGLSFLTTDVSTTSNYRVGVVAHVKVREVESGKLLLDYDCPDRRGLVARPSNFGVL
jgi:hypothetical protein